MYTDLRIPVVEENDNVVIYHPVSIASKNALGSELGVCELQSKAEYVIRIEYQDFYWIISTPIHKKVFTNSYMEARAIVDHLFYGTYKDLISLQMYWSNVQYYHKNFDVLYKNQKLEDRRSPSRPINYDSIQEKWHIDTYVYSYSDTIGMTEPVLELAPKGSWVMPELEFSKQEEEVPF